MRVLVVTPWFPSAKKPGAGAFMMRDVELLARDHDVEVLHLASRDDVHPWELPGDSREEGYRLVRQAFDSTSPRSVLRAAGAIRTLGQGVQVVHSMAMHSLLPVRLARIEARWVHTEHWSGLMSTSMSRKKKWGLRASRSTLRRPDALVAVSQTLGRAVEAITQTRVEVIPNYVNTNVGSLPAALPSGNDDVPLRLISVGNLIEHKGPCVAVETVALLRDSGTNATLTWVGVGPEATRVRDLAADLGLSEYVTLVGGVGPDEVPGLLSRAHLFVAPTRSETFGVAMAEALAVGLPVVASGVGGHLSFLPPEASRVVATREAGEFSDAIRDLVQDENRWRPTEIRAYALELFDEEARRFSYCGLYASVG